jgi:hypothetical protein
MSGKTVELIYPKQVSQHPLQLIRVQRYASLGECLWPWLPLSLAGTFLDVNLQADFTAYADSTRV